MEFEVLRDLIQVITKNKVKQIEVLGNPGQENSRTEQLYNGISKGDYNSDEEAAVKLFQTNAKDASYRKARLKLIRQLVNTSFFIDTQQSQFSDRNSAFVNCYRDLAAAKILIGKGATKAGVYLLQQILEQSIKYELTELTCEITRAIRMQYARSVADRVQHEQIAALHNQYEKKRYWENIAFDYHDRLINHYISKRSPDHEIHKDASEYYAELKPKLKEVDTYEFYYNTFSIGLIMYFSANDCVNALEICQEALPLLTGRKTGNRGSLAAIALNQLACLTQLHMEEEDDRTAHACLDLTDEGSYNWFKAMSLYFYYAIYGKKYEKALEIYAKAISHQRYKLLSDNIRDEWQLFGGYLHLLAALGQLPKAEVEKVVGIYRYAKFSNDFKVLDKDKLGMNIPLVLLPVLFSLATGDHQEYGRSVEALEKYRIRYLNNDLNRRSASFMKILFALSDRPFRPGPADRKIVKELEVLAAEGPRVAGQTFAVEIIPYEDLWKFLKPDDLHPDQESR
ncbi:MAG TPA: hypothetical protein PKL15_02450 [Saprospiraceae bacterium]|nr:hypothetical protein [Saprospiraceae bacterium]